MWLLPPARSLTPASVVVVATLRSRMATCHSVMSLASALAQMPGFADQVESRPCARNKVLDARSDYCCARVWP
jgi:hypothetical protein